MKKVYLKPREDRRIRAGHLWVFSNEIDRVEGQGENGDLVELHNARGRFLGIGYHNQHSLVAVRILTRKREDINAAFFATRISQALAFRTKLYPKATSYRLIHSEGDLLPGLIVDRYGGYLSVQIQTLGMERLRDIILATLTEIMQPQGILLRNDSPFRELEGLPLETAVAHGEIPDEIEIEESGLRFLVNLKSGQKTGFFLDQHDNRRLVRELASDKDVLDCFCYTGGFTVNACAGGAKSVLAVDQSEPALNMVRENASLNGFESRVEMVRSDCFKALRGYADGGRKFGLIILDPPAFVKSKARLAEGIRGYKEINLSAMKLLTEGGLLVTCSCSHNLGTEDFMKMIRAAARDARKRFRLLHLTTQAADHPILLAMPETQYLKCAVLECVG